MSNMNTLWSLVWGCFGNVMQLYVVIRDISQMLLWHSPRLSCWYQDRRSPFRCSCGSLRGAGRRPAVSLYTWFCCPHEVVFVTVMCLNMWRLHWLIHLLLCCVFGDHHWCLSCSTLKPVQMFSMNVHYLAKAFRQAVLSLLCPCGRLSHFVMKVV